MLDESCLYPFHEAGLAEVIHRSPAPCHILTPGVYLSLLLSAGAGRLAYGLEPLVVDSLLGHDSSLGNLMVMVCTVLHLLQRTEYRPSMTLHRERPMSWPHTLQQVGPIFLGLPISEWNLIIGVFRDVNGCRGRQRIPDDDLRCLVGQLVPSYHQLLLCPWHVAESLRDIHRPIPDSKLEVFVGMEHVLCRMQVVTIPQRDHR